MKVEGRAEGQGVADGSPPFILHPSSFILSPPRHWLREGAGPFRPADALPLSDRGFRYGMAVFETLRVRAGRVEFLGEHLWRLARACRSSRFPVTGATLREAARFLAETVREKAAWTGVARLHVTAGDGGPADPPQVCRLLVSLEPRGLPAAPRHEELLRLNVHPTPHHPGFGGRKTHNYWANVDALLTARHAGADEALLADADGHLISACLGNVFLYQQGGLFTPPTSRGARSGVQRARVIRRHGALVRDLAREEWQRPGAVFLLTNSWLGAVPASVNGCEPDAVDLRAVRTLARTINGEHPG